MKHFLYLIVLCTLLVTKPSFACDGLSATVVSNVYIGNGQYLLSIEVCEFVSNSNGVDFASVFGILITVNGASVVGVNTPSITGISSGLTINGAQIAPNQVEYGDWGNSAAPVFLAYGDPVECWTIELIVDGPAVTIDVLSSSFDGPLQPGGGMSLVNGIWACGNGLAVPPASCNSDWIPPILCEGSTTLFDLNSTTVNTGVFTGVGVDSIAGTFDPTGLSGNIPISFIVGDSLFSCSTVLDIVLDPIQLETINGTVCLGGNYNYPDGSVSTNIQVDESNISNLVSVISGCDSIVTTNIIVQSIPTTQINETICSGGDFTYPDGTISTNIITAENQTSALQSVISGCDSLVTTNISLQAIPTTQQDVVVCAGDNFTFPDGTLSTNILVTESQTSTIQMVGSGCDSIVITNVAIAAPIQAGLSIDNPNGCVPQIVTITNNSSGGPFQNCLWDFGNGTTSTDCGSQTVTYDEIGNYTITLIVQNACYTDTTQIFFDGENCSLYVPNVVSFSSLSGNNTWYVTAEGLSSFHCSIINRWGNVIKELNTLEERWNGSTNSGNFVNEGTYFYTLDITYLNGTVEQKHGFIQVVH